MRRRGGFLFLAFCLVGALAATSADARAHRRHKRHPAASHASLFHAIAVVEPGDPRDPDCDRGYPYSGSARYFTGLTELRHTEPLALLLGEHVARPCAAPALASEPLDARF